MAKMAFNKKKAVFDSISKLNIRNKLFKCRIWRVALYGAEICTFRKVDQKHLEFFFNLVRENNGKDQLDRSREKWRNITHSQGGEEHPTYNKKESQMNWSHLAWKLPPETWYWKKYRRKYRREDEEGDVSNYRMTLRKRKHTGNWKRQAPDYTVCRTRYGRVCGLVK